MSSRSASSSAALCTGLSSARHDGEPISQGISPTTIAAITAVPSAASDGVVAAVSSTQQHISASRSASQPSNRCHLHECHCHLPDSVLLRALVLRTTGQQLGEEQFHYFDAFPVSGSPHDSTPDTQTSTLKLTHFQDFENDYLKQNTHWGCPHKTDCIVSNHLSIIAWCDL